MSRFIFTSLLGLSLTSVAGAATFTITDPGMAADLLPGDGQCLTATGRCTFAAALEESEALPGPDIVEGFAVHPVISGARVILDDLTLRGPGSMRGSGVGTSLTVLAGGRLMMDGVDAGVPMTAGGGELGLRGVQLSGKLLVTAGGRLDAEDLRLSLILPAESPLVVEDGRAEITSADIAVENPSVPAILVSGGELAFRDGRLRSISWLSSDPVLVITGGAALLERTLVSGGLPPRAMGPTLISVRAGRLDLRGCELSGLDANGDGVEVLAPGTARVSCLTLSDFRGTGIRSSGYLEVTDSVLRDIGPAEVGSASVSLHGGQALNLLAGSALVERCVFSNNHARSSWREGSRWMGTASGAAIDVADASVVVRDSVISGNSAEAPVSARGGGIHVGGGSLRIERSLVEGNRAQGWGGGIAVTEGIVQIVNTSMVGNISEEGLDGRDMDDATDDVEYGGIGGSIHVAAGTLQLFSSLVVRGAADVLGGGVVAEPGSIVILADSILAESNRGDCAGGVESLGYLLVQDGPSCNLTGDLTGVLRGADPGLATQLDRRTPVPTLPLLPWSVARDAAHPAGSRDAVGGLLGTDARLWPRQADGDLDGMLRSDLGPREECVDRADADGDGRGDACDGCPFDPDDGSDADADGLGDACDDGDTDGDGTPDRLDRFPGIAGDAQADTDGDGRPDSCDPCPLAPDTGVDSDLDGVPDACDGCPSVPDPFPEDLDGDGVPNACDTCESVPDPRQEDGDGDGIGDACDICPTGANQDDGDRDGWPDACDNCVARSNANQADADRDGLGDACDNCRTVTTSDQTNSDRDVWGDACDNCVLVDNDDQLDRDGDGHGDRCDNCLHAANPDQADADADGIGDACEECPQPRDLRVRRSGGTRIELTWWTIVGSASDAYIGSLPALRAGARAETPLACRWPSSVFELDEPAGDAYFLVGARCPSGASPAGTDSWGNPVFATMPCR